MLVRKRRTLYDEARVKSLRRQSNCNINEPTTRTAKHKDQNLAELLGETDYSTLATGDFRGPPLITDTTAGQITDQRGGHCTASMDPHPEFAVTLKSGDKTYKRHREGSLFLAR
jgi:hypothetical protein